MNNLKSLRIINEKGATIVYKPELSRFFYTYTVSVYPNFSRNFQIEAQCEYGKSKIGGIDNIKSAISPNKDQQKIVIICPNYLKDIASTVYTINFIHSADLRIPYPKLEIPVYGGFNLELKREDVDADRIISGGNIPRFAAIKVLFDQNYRYLIPYSFFHHDYPSTKEDYYEIKKGTLTPVIDFKKGLTLYGISEKGIIKFSISEQGSNKWMFVELYNLLIRIFVKISKFNLLTTYGIQLFAEYKFGIIFDSMPIIGHYLSYLSETICSSEYTASHAIKRVCNDSLFWPIYMLDEDSKNLFSISDVMIHLSILLLIKAVNKKDDPGAKGKQIWISRKKCMAACAADIFIFSWSANTISLFYALFMKDYTVTSLHVRFVNEAKNKRRWIGSYIRCKNFIIPFLLVLILAGNILLIHYSVNSLFNIAKRILNQEIVWLWNNEDDKVLPESRLNEDMWSFKFLKRDKGGGFWMERRPKLLSTEFLPTKTSSMFCFLKREYAIISANLYDFDIFEQEIPKHNNRYNGRYSSYNSHLNVLEVSSGIENIAKGHIGQDTQIDEHAEIFGNTKLSLEKNKIEITKEQIEYTIGYIESKYMTYFLTPRLLSKLCESGYDISRNEMHTESHIIIKANQLLVF
ncbi:hypothetical protein BEWA_038320 [Theileria equi strain WA]|uniref:Uncharacterized protein n=1 Tax=Theileria equi strain WA TaxID=1537102 RepID=L1LEZ0_THEEQ|nr:hypothetical protein BEWA_038320 [Theileria equi strain WA]EKX73795.1 hypothetical protein BEWA_038320 [Theileria equi strain WA]|eukprot:XP_004833247.1 hypothetical protein BEWA_038320 [Theileria equi strain WA]